MAAGILPGRPGEAAAQDPGKTPVYEQYSNPQLGVTLSRPKNWGVSVVNGVIVVKQLRESSTCIFLLPVLKAHPKMEAVSFIRFMHDQVLGTPPDIRIEERRSNRTNTFAEVTLRYTNKSTHETMRGFYLVSIEAGRGIFCGYEASALGFDSDHAILKNILKSLKVSPLTFYTGTNNGALHADDRPHVGASPTIDISKLTVKLSADRTMYLAVPPDWTVGGGNYSLIATPPDEKMGVTATNDAQPTTRDPYTYLTKALFPFYRCSGTVIHKREANQDMMRFSQSQGYSSKAENFAGETTQANRQKVRFWIMVNAATAPNGAGFVNTLGFFAVPDLFERNSAVLYAMAASMGPNQQEIMDGSAKTLTVLVRLRGLWPRRGTLSARRSAPIAQPGTEPWTNITIIFPGGGPVFPLRKPHLRGGFEPRKICGQSQISSGDAHRCAGSVVEQAPP